MAWGLPIMKVFFYRLLTDFQTFGDRTRDFAHYFFYRRRVLISSILFSYFMATSHLVLLMRSDVLNRPWGWGCDELWWSGWTHRDKDAKGRVTSIGTGPVLIFGLADLAALICLLILTRFQGWHFSRGTSYHSPHCFSPGFIHRSNKGRLCGMLWLSSNVSPQNTLSCGFAWKS